MIPTGYGSFIRYIETIHRFLISFVMRQHMRIMNSAKNLDFPELHRLKSTGVIQKTRGSY